MAEETYSGDFTPLDGEGTSETFFQNGSLYDPEGPQYSPVALSNIWAEEFYELDVE